MEWINIKDKLPKKYGHYLTMNVNHNFVSKFGSHDILKFYPKEKSWYSYQEIKEGITHWMPLPEPAKD